jgi:hypothetical protein
MEITSVIITVDDRGAYANITWERLRDQSCGFSLGRPATFIYLRRSLVGATPSRHAYAGLGEVPA